MLVRLLSYNIRFGGLGREEEISCVVRAADPDVVMLQEATDVGVVERVAAAAQLPRWASQPAFSTAFMTRLDVAHHEWHQPAGSRHAFLELALGDGHTRIFGLHLRSMWSKWSERRRAREIRALLDGIKQHQQGFHALVGDFNALAPGERLNVHQMPAWIRTLVWVSGRDIARETIQTMLDAGYVDAYRALHPDVEGYTFPTWDPHVRLDYLFVPTRYRDRVRSCEVVTEPPVVARASDHHPLLSVLEVG
jgi:exodeoxyribonuclease-3